jgi:hypothetical protein
MENPMITDQLACFFDNTTMAATMTSSVVYVMPYAGREDPIYVSVQMPDAVAGSFTLTLQESADNSTWTDVQAYTITVDVAGPFLTMLRLPLRLKEENIRFTVAGATDFAGKAIFVGVTRDDFEPYAKGLYIDAGKVVA